MEQFVYLCSCLFSDAVGIGLTMQFLEDRYQRIYDRKWIYSGAFVAAVLVTALVNQEQSPFWNMTAFFLCCGLLSGLLYSGGRLKGWGRILETELFYIFLAVLEGIGGFLLDVIFKYSNIFVEDEILRGIIVVLFSKMVLLFLYYIIMRRFWKKNCQKHTREYLLYLLMMVYSIVNMIVITMGHNQITDYIVLCVSFGCLLLTTLYAFYYIQISDEKENLDTQLTLMKQQERLQFEYYKMQKEKYEQSISILHDVSKHIRSIEGLYQSNQTEEALAYTKEIDGILRPLIPVRYSDNPMFDILLAEQKRNMEKQGISFQVNLAGVELGFMEPMDVTTLFGNLLENAMEACRNCTGERSIRLEVKSQYDMLVIRIENTIEKEVCLVDGRPVHPGEENTGIGTLNVMQCVEKYGGSIIYKNNRNRFICDILLNNLLDS